MTYNEGEVTVTRIIRVTTVLAMAAAPLIACGDKPDAAHQALRIRKDFEDRFGIAMRSGGGDIIERQSTATSVYIHAPGEGCVEIHARLVGTKAPTGITIRCGNLMNENRWRLWSNEIGVLEER